MAPGRRRLVLALTRQARGYVVEAREALATATESLDRRLPQSLADAGPAWPDGLTCRILRREAARVVNGTAP